MRAFFALPLDGEARSEAAHWRRNNLLCEGRPVVAENFHITLCFLGNLDTAQVDAVVTAADRIRSAPFDLLLDSPGYFPRPKVFWIGPTRVPDALAGLADTLVRISRRAGINVERRPYQPHLTLLRKVREPATPPLRPPGIRLRCERFVLMESKSGADGVRYFPRESWQLGGGHA